jgi:hypothetical protein
MSPKSCTSSTPTMGEEVNLEKMNKEDTQVICELQVGGGSQEGGVCSLKNASGGGEGNGGNQKILQDMVSPENFMDLENPHEDVPLISKELQGEDVLGGF